MRELLDAKHLLPRDDASQRPVWDLQHLLDNADRADALDVVRHGVLGFAILDHAQTDRLAFAQRFLDQGDARLLYDRKRNHGVREEHRFLERQDADRGDGDDSGGLVRGHCYQGILFTIMCISVREVGRYAVGASVSVIASTPSAYVAVAPSHSTAIGR